MKLWAGSSLTNEFHCLGTLYKTADSRSIVLESLLLLLLPTYFCILLIMADQMIIVSESVASPLNSAGLILLGIISILTIYHFWLQSLRYVKLGNQIPGPRSIPIFGNVFEAVGQKPPEMFNYVMKKYKEMNSDVARIWVGPRLIVGLGNPSDIELILGSPIHLEKSQEYNLFEPWLGDGLLISKGEKWRSHRKMIAPTFHSTILKSFLPVFNKNANDLVDKLKDELGKVFDVHDYMVGITADILLETAMGFKSKTDRDGQIYAKAVMDMCNILHVRHYKIWLRPNFIFQFTKMATIQEKLLNIIHGLTKKVLKQKKENYFKRIANDENPSLYKMAVNATEKQQNVKGEKTENYKYIRDDLEENEENDVGEKKRLAFLDFMIEASHTPGNKLSDKDIKEEIDTIMFEGHDTTGAGLSFILCLLGVYPHVQNKVVEELKHVFQDDFYRPVTFHDTLELKYLERVIMETLRLYPPVPLIARKVAEDVKLASGDYTIPAGTTVLISQYIVHRDPKYWKNPDTFDPDNFLPERCQERHYYSYFPFSAGPRSCVGRKYAMLKLKVILAVLLRKYKVNSLAKENEFQLQADIILKRSDGFLVSLEERIV